MKYLRQYIRHIISESQESSQTLAVCLTQKGQRIEATLYDTNTLQHTLPNLSAQEESLFLSYKELATGGTIHGFIEVGPPHPGHGNCDGAWEVKRSAGPGMGRLVYGIAFALSPNGRLMPARDKVSFSAQGGWHKQLASRDKTPLDDRLAHNPDGTLAKPHRNHTDDPSDDCTTWPTRDVLNYSYRSLPGEMDTLNSLIATHNTFMTNLDGISRDEMENLLNGGGNWFFSLKYRG